MTCPSKRGLELCRVLYKLASTRQWNNIAIVQVAIWDPYTHYTWKAAKRLSLRNVNSIFHNFFESTQLLLSILQRP